MAGPESEQGAVWWGQRLQVAGPGDVRSPFSVGFKPDGVIQETHGCNTLAKTLIRNFHPTAATTWYDSVVFVEVFQVPVLCVLSKSSFAFVEAV